MLHKPEYVDEDALKKAQSGVCLRMHRLHSVSVSRIFGLIIAMAIVIFVTIIWVTLVSTKNCSVGAECAHVSSKKSVIIPYLSKTDDSKSPPDVAVASSCHNNRYPGNFRRFT